MILRAKTRPRRRAILAALLLALLLGSYWLLPIQGRVLILADPALQHQGAWPQLWLEPDTARPGEQATLYIRDQVPWPYVKLLVDGAEASYDEGFAHGQGPWTWRWRFSIPQQPTYTAVFYHDCHSGCIEHMRATLGDHAPALTPAPAPQPTKLGAVFADPSRDWHGRAGWDVELTYASPQQPDPAFTIDGLAARVYAAQRRGLRVLVRLAFGPQQALPPAGDEIALAQYLAYCARLARDQRLSAVEGYIIGAGFNTRAENALAPARPTTPEWYARVFSGYGLPPARSDNVVQTIRAIAPQLRILIGSVSPWSRDQGGAPADPLDQPWLNYMNSMAAHIDAATQAKAQIGSAEAGPDGFALRAAGRIDLAQLAGQPENEPFADMRRPQWGQAQAGFRVYRDWLAIINRYPSTRGLPAYITSTNTSPDDSADAPAQSYPAGWLSAALSEVEREPQIRALCWFVDTPLGGMWDDFSLSQHTGHLNDASAEFDRLLQR